MSTTEQQRQELEKWIRDAIPNAATYEWVIRYSNYEPPEIDSIHETEESAKKRLEELENGKCTMWEIEKWRKAKLLTLQDILIALGMGKFDCLLNDVDMIDTKLIFRGNHDEPILYDLTKDFHHQSDEFYSLLLSLKND